MSDGEITFLQIFSGHCTSVKERCFQSRYAATPLNLLLIQLYTCRLTPSLKLSLFTSLERPSRLILISISPKPLQNTRLSRTILHRNRRPCERASSHSCILHHKEGKQDIVPASRPLSENKFCSSARSRKEFLQNHTSDLPPISLPLTRLTVVCVLFCQLHTLRTSPEWRYNVL